jgi:transposase
MRNNKLQVNDTPKSRMYQLALPGNIGVRIEASAAVWSMLEITERMDYSKLVSAYVRLPKAGEASPKQMFQLVILGFMESKYSTRALEDACKHDIRFMHVLSGCPAPDHNRFWHFIKHRLQGEVAEHLFYQMVEYLRQAGEIDFQNLFIDGTKIEANANRYSFVWKKSVNRYEARLDEKLSETVDKLIGDYLFEIPHNSTAKECLEILTRLAHEQGIAFVHGRGKRKSKL